MTKKALIISGSVLLLGAAAFIIYMNMNMCAYETKANEREPVPAKSEARSDSTSSTTETSFQAVVTCPHCQFKKTETLPTEICQLKYTCTNCNAVLAPKEGDCCVFCSYSDHKCPSMQ
jgi:hypothetical protein